MQATDPAQRDAGQPRRDALARRDVVLPVSHLSHAHDESPVPAPKESNFLFPGMRFRRFGPDIRSSSAGTSAAVLSRRFREENSPAQFLKNKLHNFGGKRFEKRHLLATDETSPFDGAGVASLKMKRPLFVIPGFLDWLAGVSLHWPRVDVRNKKNDFVNFVFFSSSACSGR